MVSLPDLIFKKNVILTGDICCLTPPGKSDLVVIERESTGVINDNV